MSSSPKDASDGRTAHIIDVLVNHLLLQIESNSINASCMTFCNNFNLSCELPPFDRSKKKLTESASSSKHWSYPDNAARKMTAVTFSKQCIHYSISVSIKRNTEADMSLKFELLTFFRSATVPRGRQSSWIRQTKEECSHPIVVPGRRVLASSLWSHPFNKE